jgi:Cu/Ag efflux pump CusA
MLELILLLSLVTLALAVLSAAGFVALLAAGVATMVAIVLVDWLRHRLVLTRDWAHGRFAWLRPLARARANLLLSVSVGSFLVWLAYLWYARPPGA